LSFGHKGCGQYTVVVLVVCGSIFQCSIVL
jgi:hypothetical protein